MNKNRRNNKRYTRRKQQHKKRKTKNEEKITQTIKINNERKIFTSAAGRRRAAHPLVLAPLAATRRLPLCQLARKVFARVSPAGRLLRVRRPSNFCYVFSFFLFFFVFICCCFFVFSLFYILVIVVPLLLLSLFCYRCLHVSNLCLVFMLFLCCFLTFSVFLVCSLFFFHVLAFILVPPLLS